MPPRIEADIHLLDDLNGSLALDQLALLQAIESAGSITAAGRQIGISYKTAWERAERLNNLAREPLFVRTIGGAQGGGTSLTAYGKQMLDGYVAFKQQHSAYISQMARDVNRLDDIADFVRRLSPSTSARNQFIGEVAAITTGHVNTELRLKIHTALDLTAVITQESCNDMAITVGQTLAALIKSSSILLAKGPRPITSARNCFDGLVCRIDKGPVACSVTVDIGSGKTVTAVITTTSADSMALMENEPIWVLFKASSVVLMSY